MLTQGETGWRFISEEVLEDFLWLNLPFLGLEGLARQYGINGDICDIIARDAQGQLVILELKNCEDRGIVQQLTRYCDDTLTETRAFTAQTEHNLGVRLIAIAPSFHRHNWIDRKHHKLSFEFYTFKVIQNHEGFYLQLVEQPDMNKTLQIKLPIAEEPEAKEQVKIPPSRELKNILARCSEQEVRGITQLRESLLSVNRMEEIPQSGKVLFGRGTRICAEVRYIEKRQCAALFLWLPEVRVTRPMSNAPADAKQIGNYIYRVRSFVRMAVLTNWQSISDIVVLERGTEVSDRPQTGMHWGTRDNELKLWSARSCGYGPLNFYLEVIGVGQTQQLQQVLDLAIGQWKQKVSPLS
jgi:Endonuclease NucS